MINDIQAKITGFLANEILRRVIAKYLVPVMVCLYFCFFLALFTGFGAHWKYVDQSGSQPIAFSHRIHVTQVNLPCDYCHLYAAKARRPGIPSVRKCMSCHSNVATDKPEIKKLKNYLDTMTPIPWVRVHSLPAHVYFTHKRHIRKNIDCKECHGEVGVMDTIRRVRSLKMGWCVRCHRHNGASDDCYTCHK